MEIRQITGFNLKRIREVHGIDDVLWTDSPESVAKYIKEECKRLKRKEV